MSSAASQIIRLRIEHGRIVLVVAPGPEADGEALDAGSWTNLLARLRHEPAQAGELEAAIADVEDGLMPAVYQLPVQRGLASDQPELRRIAHAAGDGVVDLERTTVEDMFNQLADIASGSPASRYKLPLDREFTAAVLVLREVMHHGDFATIVLAAPHGV